MATETDTCSHKASQKPFVKEVDWVFFPQSAPKSTEHLNLFPVQLSALRRYFHLPVQTPLTYRSSLSLYRCRPSPVHYQWDSVAGAAASSQPGAPHYRSLMGPLPRHSGQQHGSNLIPTSQQWVSQEQTCLSGQPQHPNQDAISTAVRQARI